MLTRAAVFCLLPALPALASPPEILGASAKRAAGGWNISVTLRHDDTGWDHYADLWEVRDEAGNLLGERRLHHPHVDEQPFTRSLRQIVVPDGTRKVYIRARCNDGTWTEGRYKLKLTR
ncbi:hypothetical protein [Pseudooceanicola nanhaiensis]|uniref:hypothetical protein n=1 Tax=Pseudooceanicola nanhaiensis TaxID=375761 RepID=UPI001CD6B1E7|nr:hypothetical protein [Pseudooceanicola nanhaiensis]MCA0920540.1 hypothetical protein [Pseudooceanicola nanhaiensis]